MSGAAGRVFNATINAASISALDEIGFFDDLRGSGTIDTEAYATENDLDCASLESMLHGLACEGVFAFEREAHSVKPGAAFEDVFKNKGYFLWLVRGYGRMMESFGTILRNENRHGEYYERNGAYIARAGRDYGAQFVDRYFSEVLESRPYRRAADLGCGSAERIINLAKQRDDFSAVGVERNAGAVDVARSSIADAGLAERVSVVHADVATLAPRPEFDEVDVVFTFFMAHDLWPRENCLEALNRIHDAFPASERLLLCDTYRSDAPASPDLPIFTLGFEVTHAFMGQRIPNVAEWIDLFEDTAWRLEGRHDIGIPFSCVFDLRKR